MERGEIWWGAVDDDKGRPYLIVQRSRSIPVLDRVLAVPITRRFRGSPSELELGHAEGLPTECRALFDNLRTVPKARLIRRVGSLPAERLDEICSVANATLGC